MRARLWLWMVSVAMAFAAGIPVEALARPGGGGGFSGGGGGFSGGGGGFSGGGGGFSGGGYSGGWSSGGGGGGGSGYSGYSGDNDIGWMILLFVAMFLLPLGFFVLMYAMKTEDAWDSAGLGSDYRYVPPTFQQPLQPISMAGLREHDPNFSQILLEDFLYELYARAHEARAEKAGLDHLAPYLDAAARDTLLNRRNRNVLAVSGVIVGAMKLTEFKMRDGWAQMEVEYETNYTETYPASERGQGGQVGYYAVERWHFVRQLSAKSRTPDEVRSFNCPSCGAPVDDDPEQQCSSCGARHASGEHDWSCNGIQLRREETRGPALTESAEEVGTYDKTIVAPDLDAQLNALSLQDPEFSVSDLEARVAMVYHEMNAAWSSLDWDDARPYLSDRLWLSFSYWVHAYEEQGLQNLMLSAKVKRIELCKVAVDPFFFSVTVRVRASALDHTVHRGTGALVCGSPGMPREYSEYWTFIRSVTRKGKASAEKRCPSCGAELKISMAGNCEFCDVKVTGGAFDWVLSKIEQDETYRG